MKKILLAATGVALAIGAACSDSTPAAPIEARPPVPDGLLLSNVPRGGEGVAYISARPGTFPNAASVTVRNITRGGADKSIPVIGGGFDAVGITAATGDEVSVLANGMAGVTPLRLTVNAHGFLKIVRTDPANGRNDVATNTRFLIVFSEPVNSATLTPSTVTLSENGKPIAGRMEVPADGLRAEFIADAPLQPQTWYDLTIDSDINDLEGSSLDQGTNVAFRTATLPPVEPGGTTGITGSLAFVSERDGNSEIYAMNPDGSGLMRLTNNVATDEMPAWSPDGKRIAFVSNRDANRADLAESDIYLMNTDGSNVVRLTFGSINTGPSWSPDGRKIAFSGLRDGQFGIYVMSLDNPGSITNVGHPRGYQVDPAWSPDGTKIAFTSDWRAYDFVFDAYIANADGSGISALLEGPFFAADGHQFYFQSAWSPDGKTIAVVSCVYAWDNCYPNSTVALANSDGSGLKPLVATGGFARPAWSPDGSVIAFGSRSCRNCESSLRYVRVATGETGVITSNGHSPAWRQ